MSMHTDEGYHIDISLECLHRNGKRLSTVVAHDVLGVQWHVGYIQGTKKVMPSDGWFYRICCVRYCVETHAFEWIYLIGCIR